MAMTLYYAKVLTPTEVIERGAIVVSDQGQITYVGHLEDAPRVDGLRMDMRGRIVVPGFIDVHVHGGNGITFMFKPSGKIAEDVIKATKTKEE